METIIKKLSLALLLGASVMALKASTGLPEKKSLHLSPEKNVSAKIQNEIRLPQSISEQGFNETVKVLFVVGQEGKVENVLCVSTKTDLKTSVESQFSKLSFENLKKETLYTIYINFKVN